MFNRKLKEAVFGKPADYLFTHVGPIKTKDKKIGLIERVEDLRTDKADKILVENILQRLSHKDNRISKLEKENKSLKYIVNELCDYVYRENK